MFRRFGSRVTIVHRGPQILPREDEDVAKELQKALETEGIEIRLNSKSVQVEKRAQEIALTLESAGQSETITGSHLLVATGRRPNTDDLGLKKAGVEVDAHGYIQVNSRLETNVAGIWALGDVKGGPALILADAPYTVLKGAVYIHPTLAEGFFGLMESVKAV